MFLLARAFSSGCAALTGVEAISNGVPAFRKPKSRNAASTLLLLGLIAISMMLSVIVLANQMAIRFVDPHELDRLRTASGDALPDGYEQHPVIAQIAAGVFDHFPPGFYFVLTVTGIILVLAANTAFNGFPVLGSILAQDGLAPRSLGSRGDRLAYSNGIVFLAAMSILLIWIFDAETTKLIQLYIVGVFVSFNLSQLGMIRHWTRHLRTERDPAARRRMMRSRAINTFGLGMTAVVLVIVLITKFLAGAWITILAMGFFFVAHAGHRTPLRARRARARGRRAGQGHADPRPRDRAGLQAAQADAAGAGLRPRHPAQRPRGDLRQHRRQGHQPAAGGVGRPEPRHPAQGPALALPRGRAPDRGVHPGDPPGQPARRRGGLHPGVRRRALVGAAAPQPDGAPAQGTPALHAGRHGHLRALPAAVLPGRRGASRATRSACTPATCAAAASRRAPADRSTTYEPQRAAQPSPSGPRSLAGGGALRGRGGSRRPRRALRRPAPRAGVPRGVRAPRPAGRAGGRRDHRGHRRRPVLARRRRPRRRTLRRPRRASVPLRRTRPLRRLRLPARRAPRAARPQDGRGARAARAARPPRRGRRTS